MRRASAAALAAALALLVAGTGFHLVPTAAGLWRGASDPPGAERLALAAAGGLLAALVLRRFAAAAPPLLALWAAALPAIAVLAGGPPLLLLVQGPVLLLLAAASLSVALLRVAAGPLARCGPVPAPWLFAVSWIGYLTLQRFLPGPAGAQGDEPHYLTMALSLLRDLDLDLANQFQERQYAEFFGGVLAPHASPASPLGRLYSIHAPGLPALLAPAYALGGEAGARAVMAALAALTAALAYRLVRETLGSAPLALASWAVLSFTPPLPFHAGALYPEIPAALATAVFLLSSRRPPSGRMLAAAGAAAALLIWIHPKFLPLAGAGLLLTLLRPGPRRGRALAALAFLGSLALLLAYYQRLYGAPSLAAAYGPGFAGDVRLAHAPAGLLGLLFDRQFGLLPLSPVWALALPGAVALCARRRVGDGLRAALLAGSTAAVGASFSMWWGGASPPARFLVPALPAAALWLAPALARRERTAAALAGLGLGVVLVAAAAPSALHNRGDGASGLLRVLAPALDLDPGLPGFAAGEPSAPLLAATAAGGAALSWRAGGPGCAAAALAYLLVAAGARGDRPLLDARAASLALVDRWDGARLAGPHGAPAVGDLRIPLELKEAPWPLRADEVRNSRPLDLPAGLFELRVAARVTEALPTARVARLDVFAGGLLLERRYLREDQALEAFALPLPAGARRLTLTAAGIQGRGVVESATLVPIALPTTAERAGLSWPRLPREDLYRVPNGLARATALDRVERDGAGFHVDGEARFVVEAAAGALVDVLVERARPSPGDVLHWGRRRLPLGRSPALALQLPADDGVPLAGLRLVPARLAAQGSRITFSGSPGATSATASSTASPASTPSETSKSPPPDSAKK